MTYNITQEFAANAGVTYNLSAYASEASNGALLPDCYITICGGEVCSAATPLTSVYAVYSYLYRTDTSDTSAIATFGIMCSASAYVALDDIDILPSTIIVLARIQVVKLAQMGRKVKHKLPLPSFNIQLERRQ